jgi:rhomboid-like protein
MQPYADATEGKRLCWKICLLNAGVWLAWKIKPWNGFMTIRFMHYPLSGLSYTLLTSMFRYAGLNLLCVFADPNTYFFCSHRSAIHLLCNCLALESFGKDSFESLTQKAVLCLFQDLRHTTTSSANRTKHSRMF